MLSERRHTQKAVFSMVAFTDVQDLYKDTENSGFQELGVRGGVDCMRNRRVLGAMELLCTLVVVGTCLYLSKLIEPSTKKRDVYVCCCSGAKLYLTLCDLIKPAALPCPLLSPRVCSNSCPSSWWYHPTISSSVVPFSSCLQLFPASNLSQHQGLFQWVSSSHQVAKVLEFQP